MHNNYVVQNKTITSALVVILFVVIKQHAPKEQLRAELLMQEFIITHVQCVQKKVSPLKILQHV